MRVSILPSFLVLEGIIAFRALSKTKRKLEQLFEWVSREGLHCIQVLRWHDTSWDGKVVVRTTL